MFLVFRSTSQHGSNIHIVIIFFHFSQPFLDNKTYKLLSVLYPNRTSQEDNLSLGRLDFEYNDEEERALKDSIESQLYEVREQDLLIAMKIASSHINPLGGN